MMPASLIPSAEPFFFPGGASGCLLVHGFTGAPKEMRWLGEYLAAQGHTVLAVRLAGHASRPEDLLRVHWQDWLLSVMDGWYLLNGALERHPPQSKRIFVIGLSLGGVLALLLAAQQPVDGVVTLSTPYALPQDPRLPFIGILSWIQPRVAKGEPDWHNPQAAQDHVEYPYYPTKAIIEVKEALERMRAVLSEIHTPALLMHSREDGSVDPKNMKLIYDHLGSEDKKMLWVENSGHVIVREPQRQRVFEAVNQFIKRLSQEHS
jgi:carboxylesterase